MDQKTATKRNRTLGSEGEALVASKLSESGWTILARNFRCIGSELDILAQKGTTIICVEVKTRTQYSNKYPIQTEHLISKRKLQALQRGMMSYLAKHPNTEYHALRIDLALITCTKVGLKLGGYWVGQG